RGQEVVGQPDHLVGVHVADADLGQPDRAQPDVAVAPAYVRVVHPELQLADHALADVDPLSRDPARGVAELYRHRFAFVEAQRGSRDVTVAWTGDRLQQRDVVGRDRSSQLDQEPLAAGVEERAHAPRRLRITVEGEDGAVLGRVGDRGPVARRTHGA